jgi:methionyl-tRNA synthetase
MLATQANITMTNIAPWAQSPSIARASYDVSLQTLRICGICIQPFAPSLAGKLLDALGVDPCERTWEFATLTEWEDSREIREKGVMGSVARGVKLFEPLSLRQTP